MKLAGVRCVVFDIDDTLYLERDYVHSGFRAVDRWVQANLSREGFFAAAWQLFDEGHRGRIFDEALAKIGRTPDEATVGAMVSEYRRHDPEIALLADARECLDRLHGRELRLACVSDGPLASQEAKARALGLDRWLNPIVLTARYGEGFGKPHPRGFVEICERLGCEGASCVYVADNPAKDFKAPRQLGWRTVRMRRVGGLQEAVASGEDVDSEINDLRGFGA